MNGNASFTIGSHFVSFIDAQIQGGRYRSPSDVVVAGLRLLEEHEARIHALQDALQTGLDSGEPKPFDFDQFKKRKHMEHSGR